MCSAGQASPLPVWVFEQCDCRFDTRYILSSLNTWCTADPWGYVSLDLEARLDLEALLNLVLILSRDHRWRHRIWYEPWTVALWAGFYLMFRRVGALLDLFIGLRLSKACSTHVCFLFLPRNLVIVLQVLIQISSKRTLCNNVICIGHLKSLADMPLMACSPIFIHFAIVRCLANWGFFCVYHK